MSKKNRLNIGRIPYANVYPIFYYLDNECDISDYRFIKGVPSKLNLMLRDGTLDISPSSSIEYLRNKSRYTILPSFSISSSGPINSIFLFSKFPLTELGGKTLAVSTESATSTALLKIILKEFLSLKCKFVPADRSGVKNLLSIYSGVLHIGDTAMSEAKKVSHTSSSSVRKDSLYVYDLAELWDRYTGLPFVFALWMVRKKLEPWKNQLIKRLSEELINANKYAAKNFSRIARKAPQNKWLSEKELVAYWKLISYDLTEKHLEGLRLFETLAKKIRI